MAATMSPNHGPSHDPSLEANNGDTRPKGILKNSSYNASTSAAVSPELSERELTQMNTDLNAGTSQRRNSSNPRSSTSRRQSGSDDADDKSQRLKWDEANLYLNEGQMGGKMKIDEPKTPFAGQYDPSKDDNDEDEEEETKTTALNPDDIVVDELDQVKSPGGAATGNARSSRKRHAKGDDIPGLDIGEPEMAAYDNAINGEKRVVVDNEQSDHSDGARHGEDDGEMSSEEREKHAKFEEMRKKHYEMKNVKDLLGHTDEVEDDDDAAES